MDMTGIFLPVIFFVAYFTPTFRDFNAKKY